MGRKLLTGDMVVLLNAIEMAPTSRLSDKNADIEYIDFMSGLREPFKGCNMGKTDGHGEKEEESPDTFIPSTAGQLARLAAAWAFMVPIPFGPYIKGFPLCAGDECCQATFSMHNGWARVNPARYLIPPPTCYVNKPEEKRRGLTTGQESPMRSALMHMTRQLEVVMHLAPGAAAASVWGA